MDDVQLFGRERDLGLLREFMEVEGPPRTLLLSGAAGIGKTTLWEATVARSRAQGLCVLASRASGAEAQVSFACLIDLLDGVEVAMLSGVPAPQRRALDVALLRAEPESDPPEPQAIALGLLNVLRALSARTRVLLAIDDVQWLDAPSRDALAFAVRRLRDERIAILLARRAVGTAGVVERALGTDRIEQIDVGPLSLGALRGLLSERLGLTLPRSLLRRIADATLGNPLFALELGRLIAGRELPGIVDELPVPDAVEDLLDARVGTFSPSVRRLMLALALSAELRVSQLEKIVDADALDDAVAAGLVLVERDRVRPFHPLVAAMVKRRARGVARRKLHLELAGIVADDELRALHLALGTDAVDAEIGATVADAAAAASARGARREAVELGEHALRLTPPGAARSETLLSLATYLETAGELQRMTDLLTSELESITPGRLRGRAWLLLAEGMHVHTVDDYKQHLERALAEAHDDPALHARVVAKISSAVIGVERIRDAELQLLDVLPAARRAGPDVERPVLYALAWARGLGGRPLDEICERFAECAASPGFLAWSPERVAAQRLVWRGEIEQARIAIERLFALADERGEAVSVAWARIHLCELALRVGDWGAASRLLTEWAETSEGELFVPPAQQRCRGLLAAGRGFPEEAERWAREAIAGAEAVGTQWDRLEGLRTLGVAATLRYEPAAAAQSLRTVWTHAANEGVDEPGVFPVAPELVEALVEIGELDEAHGVTERLRLLAEEQEHPWGLVTARRCDALVRLAAGAFDEDAATTLESAADEYGALALPFDRARTLLVRGRVLRRRRKWAAARRSLEQALLAFGALDAPGWADEARGDLARVGARRPGPAGALTPAEQRVADLAAAGRSNKEIARTLFISPKTVEIHLSHVYAKLGVHSRTQLARLVQS
jgi:DNA-binding CsgD family transcriptional regulator